MSSFLVDMRKSSLARLIQARSAESEQDLWRRARDAMSAPALKLDPQRFDVIAECKLRSPAAGDLSTCTPSIEARVVEYARSGACAVSVLTENLRFGGCLDHLRRAASALQRLAIPAMRKDFLLDPYQVMEARAAGAGGVLVIVRMLSREQLAALLDCAAQLRMFVLLETFDAHDLNLASELLSRRPVAQPAVLVGVNCRDLSTLQVEPERFATLTGQLPDGFPAVAESGLHQPSDVPAVVAQGYRVALIGSALMRVKAAGAALAAFLAAGRRADTTLRNDAARIGRA